MKIKTLLAFALTSAAMISCVQAQDGTPIFEMRGGMLEGGASGGGGVFFPVVLDSGDVIFLDADASYTHDSLLQASAGLGYRHRVNSSWIIGAYGYYDFLNGAYGNEFHQLSFGAEAVSPDWEARVNAYIPFGDIRITDSLNNVFASNNQLFLQRGIEEARGGMDAEVGMRLPFLPEDSKAQVKIFGGGYWYKGETVKDTVGAKLRAEVDFTDLDSLAQGTKLTLGAAASYDNEDHFKGEVVARLRVPLGTINNNAIDPIDPMIDRVERNRTIRTHAGATGDIEQAVAVNIKQPKNIITISAADGDADAINAILMGAGPDALVLIDGSLNLDKSLQLGQDQYVLGGGGSFAVRGAQTGTTGQFVNRHAATTLTGLMGPQNILTAAAVQDVVTMASGSTLSTVTIRGGHAGIASTNTKNVRIENVDIAKTGRDGIRLENVKGATISDSTIHDLTICNNNTDCEFSVYDPNSAPYSAINALGTSDLTIRNTHMDRVTYGLFSGSRIDDNVWPPKILNAASNITLDNVTVTNSRREALLFVSADNVAMNHVTVDNSQSLYKWDMDLVVLQGSSNVSIRDMSLKGGINGLMLASASTLPTTTHHIDVDGLTIDGTKNSGIFFNPVTDVSLSNVSISNAGTYGMFIYGSEYDFLGGPVSDITFDHVQIDHAKDGGLYFIGPSVDFKGDITMTNTSVLCEVSKYGNWIGGSLTQSAGSVLTVNNEALDQTNFLTRCQ